VFSYTVMRLNMKDCNHSNVECLNPYELIRKYRCNTCGAVMMCACDKEHGEKFFPHQLNFGHKLETQERIPVTHGFHVQICQECRGENPTSTPVSSTPGRTSKITRYYWREIAFETTRRFYEQYPDKNPHSLDEFNFPEDRKKIEKEVLNEIKKLHDENPKYDYSETTQSEIIEKCGVEVILVNAVHEKGQDTKVRIVDGESRKTVEEFATDYFINRGYKTLETESIPFHVIFGIYMWFIIQDINDPKNRLVSFGSRSDFDEGFATSMITTLLPEDFGTEGYFKRREKSVCQHIEKKIEDIEWLFDYWLPYSHDFRQYLWAHRQVDVDKAKNVIAILGVEKLKKVLKYLVLNYWENFCGWPDLLVYNKSKFFFVEVKSSNDKLSDEQKNWILGNHNNMQFEFKIFKVGKKRV